MSDAEAEYHRRISFAKNLSKGRIGYEDAVHDIYIDNPFASFEAFIIALKKKLNINYEQIKNIGKSAQWIGFAQKKKTDYTRKKINTDPVYKRKHLDDNAKWALNKAINTPGWNKKRSSASALCEKNKYAENDSLRQKHSDACNERQKSNRLSDTDGNALKNLARSIKRKLKNKMKRKK